MKEVFWLPSEKILEQKKEKVRQLAEKMAKAKTIVLADYRGVTVEEDTKLRSELRKENVEYKVVKNTYTLLAAKQNNLESLEEYLHGPTSIAMSYDDPVAPARLLVNYAKTNKNFELKAGILEGELIGVDRLIELANLPSRDVLIATLLSRMNAPISGFANVLNANIRGLAIALNAIAEQKQGA